MQHRTTACFLILLLLCCGLKCNTDVARVVLPEVTDTSETTPLFAMEAILATRGEVHSPIPDDVYDALWGHWTEVGLSAPRDYYTKYIDAGGIAIVGSDLVDDRIFQVARHIVLVMTSKLPGLREALSIDAPGPGFFSDGSPFRLTLTEHFSDEDVNLPEYQSVNRGTTAYWIGECGGIVCRADVWWTESEKWEGKRVSRGALNVMTHEMVHAIHYEILEHNLVPDFVKRLDAAYLHENISIEGRSGICANTGWGVGNHAEFFAHAVADKWLDNLFIPPDTTVTWLLRELDMPDTPENRALLAVEPDSPDAYLELCPILTDLLAEVFPAVPLQWAIYNRNYNPQKND